MTYGHMIDIRKNTANCYHRAGYEFYCQEMSWKLTILIMESHQGGTMSRNVDSMGSLSRDGHTWTVAKLTVAALAQNGGVHVVLCLQFNMGWEVGGHPGQSQNSCSHLRKVHHVPGLGERNLEYLEQKPRQARGERVDTRPLGVWGELRSVPAVTWSTATLDHEWCVSVTGHTPFTHTLSASFLYSRCACFWLWEETSAPGERSCRQGGYMQTRVSPLPNLTVSSYTGIQEYLKDGKGNCKKIVVVIIKLKNLCPTEVYWCFFSRFYF